MAAGVCDNCGEEPAKWLMHDTDTGDVRGLGLECLQLIGLGMVAAQGPEAQDAVFATIGYQPTAATKKARKAAEEPEVDVNRTIAEVVETGPREDASDELEHVETTAETLPDVTTPAAQVEAEGDDPPPY